jgi:hypothetical protein
MADGPRSTFYNLADTRSFLPAPAEPTPGPADGVPEPSTLALLLAGAAGLFACRQDLR